MPSVINPRSVSLNLNRAEQDGLWFNSGRELTKQFASLFGITFDDSDAVSQAAQGVVNRLATSTFTGFSSEIGQRQDFDCVKFSIFPWDGSDLPDQLRVLIRESTYDGTILANVIVPLPNVQEDQPYEVTAELGGLIANAGSSELHLVVLSNGKIGYGEATEKPTAENIRYRTDQNLVQTSANGLSVTSYGEIYAKTFQCGSRNVVSNGYWAGASNLSSTFTGWGNTLSAIPSTFNLAQIWLQAFDATALPTKVRVRFRDTSHDGTIIATAIVNVSFADTGPQLVTFFFDQDIDLSAYATVWFEFVANGKVGLTYASDLSAGSERYAALGGTESLVANLVVSPTNRQPWLRTILQDRTAGLGFDAGALAKAINLSSSQVGGGGTTYTPSVDILFPATIPAIENYEANIYIDGAIDSYIPRDALLVTGGTSSTSTGKMTDDRYHFTPSGGGSHTVSLTVANNGTTLKTASTTLSYKAETVGNGQSRKCLIVGDSIVDGGVIPSTLLANVAANASSTYSLTLIGTAGSGPNLHEGYGGYEYASFVGASSPFYFGGAFDFATYLSTNGFTMDAGDSVFLLLGTNDLFGQDDDSQANTKIAAMTEDLNEIIASIHAHNAGINIWIGMTCQPAYGQTAWGQTYGGTQANPARVKRNYALWRRHLIDLYDGLGVSDKIWLCPVHCAVDTKYNYKSTSIAVNARNSTTTDVQYDPVHPSTDGEEQIADVLYACLMSLES